MQRRQVQTHFIFAAVRHFCAILLAPEFPTTCCCHESRIHKLLDVDKIAGSATVD
jgi:hypothetical protein